MELKDLVEKLLEGRLESDSVIGSCSCLTKTNVPKHHKPGCKYRLIMERDEARELLALEKVWKEEDPRMLREQLRVEEASYQSLHERHKALQEQMDEMTKERDCWIYNAKELQKAFNELENKLKNK